MKKIILTIIGLTLAVCVAVNASSIISTEWRKVDTNTFQKVETIIKDEYKKSELETEKAELEEIKKLSEGAFSRTKKLDLKPVFGVSTITHSEAAQNRIDEIDNLLLEFNKIK